MKFKRDEIVNLTTLLVIAVAVASLQACTALPPRPPAPPLKAVTTAAPFLLGVNDGGHTGVPADIAHRYCAANREFVNRAAVSSVDEAAVVLESLKACDRLHGLLLVEQADVHLVQQLAPFVAQRPDVWGVELGNELDLAGLTPQQFATFIVSSRAALRDAGYMGRILIGGIYTVDRHSPQDFEAYVRPAIAACPDCLLALHWYGDTSDYWLARVQALGVDVVVTEFGMPACTPAQEDQQLAYLREKLSAFRRTGNVLAAIVYQRLSAPAPCTDTDASHLAHFGFERPDGSLKPAVAIFSEGH